MCRGRTLRRQKAADRQGTCGKDLEKSRKLSIIGQAHKDWIDNAHEASGNRNREEDNPFRSRPGDDLKFIDVLIDDRLHNGSLIPKEKEAEK